MALFQRTAEFTFNQYANKSILKNSVLKNLGSELTTPFGRQKGLDKERIKKLTKKSFDELHQLPEVHASGTDV